MLKIWCVLLFGTLGAFAQAPKLDNLMTGRAWEALPDTVKLFYAVGMRDGLTMAAYSLPPDVRELMMENTQAKGFNPGDYVKELDRLYSERENLNIAVPLAYQYVTTKLKGASTAQQLEQMLIGLRKIMAQ